MGKSLKKCVLHVASRVFYVKVCADSSTPQPRAAVPHGVIWAFGGGVVGAMRSPINTFEDDIGGEVLWPSAVGVLPYGILGCD